MTIELEIAILACNMLHESLKTIKQSQGLRLSALMTVGNLMAAFFSAIALLYISRYLGPEEFGYFGVGFSIILILSRIIDAGLTQSLMKYIPQTVSLKESSLLIGWATKIKLAVYLVTLTIGLLLSPWLVRQLNFEVPQIFFLAFVLSIATVGFEHVSAILLSFRMVKQAVLANITQAVTKLLTALMLILILQGSTMWLFLAYMISPIVPVLLIRKLIPTGITINFFGQQFANQRQRMGLMASHAAIGYIAAGLIENVDILFIQAYTDPYSTGLFAGASRITMLVMILAYSLANVLNPRVARYKDVNHLKRYFVKASLLALAVVIIGIGIIPLSKVILLVTIGSAYVGATASLQLLLASAMITIASVPFIALFFAYEKAEWYFSFSGLIQLLVVVLGNYLFVPTMGIEAAAWTRLVAKLVLFFSTFGLGWWYFARLSRGQTT